MGPPAKRLNFEGLTKQLAHVLNRFEACGYFPEAFGYDCVDAGPVPGTLGPEPNIYLSQATGRDNLWPFDQPIEVASSPFGGDKRKPRWSFWDTPEWFDLIEVLHDLVSKPVDGHLHDCSGCGWHFATVDQNAGRKLFRDEINYALSLADPAYEMTSDGEIITSAREPFKPLLAAATPKDTEQTEVIDKIASAERAFRSRSATKADRQHAVRDVADVLEHLRPQIKEAMLKEDDSALFNIANNFAIRHNNANQRTRYDDEIWLRWLFYVELAERCFGYERANSGLLGPRERSTGADQPERRAIGSVSAAAVADESFGDARMAGLQSRQRERSSTRAATASAADLVVQVVREQQRPAC